MATEPRKPKYTNPKALKWVRHLVILCFYGGIFVGFTVWQPALVIAVFAFFALSIVGRAMIDLRTWQQAQWVSRRSIISKVEIDVLGYRSLLSGEDRRLPVTVKLENGDEIDFSRRLFDSIGTSYVVSYKTRALGGEQKFSEVAGDQDLPPKTE